MIPTLFLHSCCAPCSSYVLEYLSNYFKITVFYYNPNITEETEYKKRVAEQARLISELDTVYPIQLVEGTYDPQRFYEITKGMEQMDEGGERCFACYRLRLEEAAKLAADGGFDYVTTTLSISPMKNAEKLNEIGAEVGAKYGIPWLFSDFRKRMAISVLWSCQRSMICTARAIVAAATQRHRQKERGGSDGTAKNKRE